MPVRLAFGGARWGYSPADGPFCALDAAVWVLDAAGEQGAEEHCHCPIRMEHPVDVDLVVRKAVVVPPKALLHHVVGAPGRPNAVDDDLGVAVGELDVRDTDDEGRMGDGAWRDANNVEGVREVIPGVAHSALGELLGSKADDDVWGGWVAIHSPREVVRSDGTLPVRVSLDEGGVELLGLELGGDSGASNG